MTSRERSQQLTEQLHERLEWKEKMARFREAKIKGEEGFTVEDKAEVDEYDKQMIHESKHGVKEESDNG